MQEVGPEMLEVEDDLSKYPQTNRRERRKHLQGKEKPQPMSLQEFHQEASRGSGDVGLDEIELPQVRKVLCADTDRALLCSAQGLI